MNRRLHLLQPGFQNQRQKHAANLPSRVHESNQLPQNHLRKRMTLNTSRASAARMRHGLTHLALLRLNKLPDGAPGISRKWETGWLSRVGLSARTGSSRQKPLPREKVQNFPNASPVVLFRRLVKLKVHKDAEKPTDTTQSGCSFATDSKISSIDKFLVLTSSPQS